MLTRSKFICALSSVLLFCSGAPCADNAPDGEVVKSVPPAAELDGQADLDAIRATAKAFVKAFNARDAKAIGALWLENADYRDDTGNSYVGRGAIQQKYAEFFDDQSQREMKLEISVESVRLIAPTLAVEDGVATISPPVEGRPVSGRYSAVQVRQDGKWLLASVREWSIDLETNYYRLQPLNG
jgi:uncharacterized protein (TIGR02246 family)